MGVTGLVFENPGVEVGEPKNSEKKNSPKIGVYGWVPQFWNLSRPKGPLSPRAKIAPKNPLGEHILWVEI